MVKLGHISHIVYPFNMANVEHMLDASCIAISYTRIGCNYVKSAIKLHVIIVYTNITISAQFGNGLNSNKWRCEWSINVITNSLFIAWRMSVMSSVILRGWPRYWQIGKQPPPQCWKKTAAQIWAVTYPTTLFMDSIMVCQS